MTQRILAALAAACALGGASAQESYPSRAVHIVVPYTPGTGADILARLLGPKLAERWKVAVITENRAGASGNIGTESVAKAAPDGHTLLLTATSFTMNPALTRSALYDPVAQFSPVVLMATGALAVVVTAKLPVTSMREFVAYAKQRPGELHYSSPGNGTPHHLAMELLKLDLDMRLVHVPYRGSGGAMSDLVGGHVQAMVSPLQSVAPHVQAGRLRMLGIMSAERSAAFPGVPTLKELGLGELEVETWYALFAPAGTRADVVAKINGETNLFLNEIQMREALGKQGMTAAGGPAERLGELVRRELARWSRVVAAAGIKAD